MANCNRSCTWANIIYTDSCTSDINGIKDYFDQIGVQFYLSPLHDSDKLDDGKTKKAHYHIMLVFPSLKSHRQVAKILEPYTIVHPIIIQDKLQYGRYLCHLDNPEKSQYNINDVVCNGDYSKFVDNEKEQSNFEFVFDAIVNRGESITWILNHALSKGDYALVKCVKDNLHLLKVLAWERNAYKESVVFSKVTINDK